MKPLGPLLALGALALPGVSAFAQPAAYPVKPIRIIVPLAPGGPSDIMARTLAQKLSEGIGQPIVVENRPGASGIIGTEIATKSAPDGYTLLLVSNAISINVSLFRSLPYDALRDLAAVSLLAATPYVLGVHPSLPVRSVKQLVALARARPGELNHASGGSGTGPHLAMELLMQKTGIKVVHVVYRGGGPAMIDFIAGHTQVYMANMVAAFPQVKAGKMRALAVSTALRSPVAPDVPTIAEAGVPDFDEQGQHGIVAPAGVPKEIIGKVHGYIVKAMHSPEVRNRLQADGSEVVASTPEEYAAVIRRDIEKWRAVIQSAGITPQ